MADRHTVQSAYDTLIENGHKIIQPGPRDPQVITVETRGYIGIKAWGLIDFLVNHKRHMLSRS